MRELDSIDGLVWAGVLVAGLVLTVAWIRTSASWWLRALGGRRPVLAQTVGLLIGGIALTSFTAIFSTVRELRPSLAISRAASSAEHQQVDAQVWAVPEHVWQFVMDGELLVIAHKPYFVPVLALLILFPFAAAFARRGPLDAPWAFLDPGGRLQTPPLTLRPLLPLAIGAVAGIGFLVLAALIRLYMHYGVSAESRAQDVTLLSFFVSMVALAVLVQLVAGAAGASARRPSRRARRVVRRRLLRLARHHRRADRRRLRDAALTQPWTVRVDGRGDVLMARVQQLIAQGAIASLAGGLLVVGVQAIRRRRAAEQLQPAGIAP